MHKRLVFKKNHFNYRYFMFYIDLDEAVELHNKHRFFSVNKWNLFSLRDRDHMIFDAPGIKSNIIKYLNANGISTGDMKVHLLTNTAVLGYNFNPVSFYFCFDKQGKPVCVVPEVGNTFGELKPYLVGNENLQENTFSKRVKKEFYVSPFIAHDTFFDFNINVPGKKLSIHIDDYKDDEKIFMSHLSGVRMPLSDALLLKYALRYPLVTLKIIALIHYQALKLFISGLPFFRKIEFPELQIGVMQKWKS
ncbi:MAG: DUF1365 domain-containing protein [Ignavibacteria bacterium]|nr:DUF1365 domain-containing protein [Ignavibacteria bacterium]